MDPGSRTKGPLLFLLRRNELHSMQQPISQTHKSCVELFRVVDREQQSETILVTQRSIRVYMLTKGLSCWFCLATAIRGAAIVAVVLVAEELEAVKLCG